MKKKDPMMAIGPELIADVRGLIKWVKKNIDTFPPEKMMQMLILIDRMIDQAGGSDGPVPGANSQRPSKEEPPGIHHFFHRPASVCR